MKYLYFVLPFLMASCCTVVNGRHTQIDVQSNISDADVYVNGLKQGKTPCTVNVKRRGAESIEIIKDGYYPYRVNIKRSGSWWLAGNFLVGGLIGLVVDLTTGSHIAIEPEEIDITLTPKPTETVANKNH